MEVPNSDDPSPGAGPRGEAKNPQDATLHYKDTEGGIPSQFDRYKLIREAGRGAMGVLYLALDTHLDRQVALKIPNFQLLGDADSIERFYREARSMATMHHPNICPVFDVGRFQKWHYMTMPFIEGKPLSKMITESGGLTVASTLTIVRKIALGLQFAHESGIVHRDLKPSNIMINKEFEPIIMDFGLARRDREGEVELTQTGAVFGTPAFMAPEQVEGDQAAIGPQVDVYALGVVLFQMLTGKLPFQGSTTVLFSKIRSQPAEPPSNYRKDLPADLDRLCLGCLKKSTKERYQSAKDVIAEIDSFGSETTNWILSLPPPTRGNPTAADVGSQEGSDRQLEAELRQVTIAQFSYEVMQDSVPSHQGSSSEFFQRQEEAFAGLVKQSIQKHGGVWVSSSGQEVLTCFGYPIAYEDASRRAVRASLEIRQMLERESQSNLLPQVNDFWCTIHSGEVVAEANPMESAGVTLSGEAKMTAHRVHAVVEPGSICVTSSTHQRISLYFETTSLGPRRVRGLPQPVELFQVQREASSQNRVELIDPGNLSPLVGRDTELSILKDRWEQTIEGLGQVVLLVGEAGLGKSRLIRELRELVLEGEDQNTAVLEFRCSQYHTNAGLHPIIETLSRLIGVDKVDRNSDPADRWDKLKRYLQNIEFDQPETVALFGALLGLPPDPRYPSQDFTPQKQRELSIELLLEWLQKLSRKTPVLVIYEDLHWIDPSTLEYLGKHVAVNQMNTVLTLLTFRPQFEVPWKNSPHQTQIALNRLTKRQVGEWIRRQMGGKKVADALLEALLERTDGIPLFIEEFTRVLQDSGAFESLSAESRSDWFKVIPSTLNDLLMARLDRMQSEKDVIQLASTIGREFSFELLAAASSYSVVDLTAELEKLVSAEIVFQKGTGGNAHYIFKHALLQDAAYRSMLSKKRQACHLRIAQVLESRFPEVVENQPELLANHYSEAHLPRPAIEYWSRAGGRARVRSQHYEAISHYKNGLQWVQQLAQDNSLSPVQLAGMELGLTVPYGTSILAAKGYATPEAGPVFEKALTLAETVGDLATKFYILWGIWAWRLVGSDLVECSRLHGIMVQVAQQLAERDNDPSWLAETAFVPQVNRYYEGRFRESLDAAQDVQGNALSERCKEHAIGTGQNVRPCSQSFYGMSLWALGRVDEALEQAREAIRNARELNHPMSLSFAFHHSSWTLLCNRLWEEALPIVKEALELAVAQGLALWKASATAHLGACLLYTGRVEEGIKHLEEGFEGFIGTGGRCAVGLYMNWIADGHRQLKNYEKANDWIERSIRWCSEYHQQNHVLSDSYRISALIRAAIHESSANSNASQDATQVDELFQKSIEIAQSQSALSWELRSRLDWSKYLQARGREDNGIQELNALLSKMDQGNSSLDWLDAKAWLASVNSH